MTFKLQKLQSFFCQNNIKLQVRTNYKLHEMNRSKARLNRIQNLMKFCA